MQGDFDQAIVYLYNSNKTDQSLHVTKMLNQPRKISTTKERVVSISRVVTCYAHHRDITVHSPQKL